MKPFIKYVGGKTSLLSQIFPYIPEKFNNYYEPFVGGGALFFALNSEPIRRFRNAFLNDINYGLINTYRQVRSSPSELMAELEKYIYCNNEEDYYEIRKEFNQFNENSSELIEYAAKFIYLNKTCRSGLYRENKSGQFNVPYGKYTNPILYNIENIKFCSLALYGASLRCEQFYESLGFVRKDDFVFLDPPYDPKSKTANFTHYQRHTPWNTITQEHVFDKFEECIQKGAKVIACNNDTPFVRNLYKDYNIIEVEKKTGIKGKVKEVIIVS